MLHQIQILQIIYVDDTKIESSNSTLSGVIEIYIESYYRITCTKIRDLMPLGTGATPTYHSGGPGKKFVFFNVQGQYGHGIHFKVIVRGIIKTTADDDKSSEV